jgi:V8-like Glu-specific endopeptidase
MAPANDSGASDAVSGGVRTTHPSVVLLEIDTDHYYAKNGPVSAYCAGTHVAPDLILTAAHCVHPAYVGPSPTITAQTDGQPRVVDGVSRFNSIDVTPTPDPDFVPPRDANGNVTTDAVPHDLAFLRLSGRLSAPIATLYNTSVDQSLIGLTMTATGFMNRNGTVGVEADASYQITRFDDAFINGNYSDSGAVCPGDSGGGVFATVAGTEYLIGVTNSKDSSSKTAICGDVDMQAARLDANLSFIGQFLPNLAPLPAPAPTPDPTS